MSLPNRKEKKFYSESGSEKYIVRKNYNGKEVHVVKFYEEQNPADVIVEICGENGGKVYEVTGTLIESAPTSGRWSMTLKELCEEVAERIERNGYYS